MDELAKKVAPVTTPLGKTAASLGGQLGRLAQGAVDKFELTPTPHKKAKAL